VVVVFTSHSELTKVPTLNQEQQFFSNKRSHAVCVIFAKLPGFVIRLLEPHLEDREETPTPMGLGIKDKTVYLDQSGKMTLFIMRLRPSAALKQLQAMTDGRFTNSVFVVIFFMPTNRSL
jgi:hypothetical protein